MKQICTTMEQSKKLQELGISVDTADMFYPLGSSFPEVCDSGDNLQVDYPAWSLGALIAILPDTIIRDDKSCCGLSILNMGVYYQSLNGKEIVHGCEKDSIFENCIDMVVWLVNERHIKTK
ncbi:hypothetical protein [Prevotella sp. oral taxon 376]|uniref:hypothetical protein n=1 Tax=Prevotella sp. oral taxon 376 TaxID=712466 RepID=UPI0011B1DEF2|nr:hypothetical protein [Prevotella sp. oral taxon 376]